jgi:hypothetical protein
VQTRRIVILLLVLQAASMIFLWTLDDLNEISEGTFALFLSVGLISFSIISYSYRVDKLNQEPSRIWVLAGCVLALVLLFSSLVLARAA